MNTERLARMLTDAIAIDFETHLTQPGLAAPPPVCAAIAWWEQGRAIGKLLDKTQALAAFQAILANEKLTIVNANIAFDMLVAAVELAKQGADVLPAIFAAYDAGRVFDPLITEMLHAIAFGLLGYDLRTKRKLTDPETKKPGRYSHAIVHEQVTGEADAKRNDRFRKSYHLLEHIPISEWPEDARTYPVDDATKTLRDGLAQAGLISNVGPHEFENPFKPGEFSPECRHCGKRMEGGLDPRCVSTYKRHNIHDTAIQSYTHWCMSLGAAWGLTPDAAAVARLRHSAMRDLKEEEKPFIAAGIIRGDGARRGSVDENALKKLQAQAYGAGDHAPCPVCIGTLHPAGKMRGARAPGKIPSPATQGRTLINCKACDGSGWELNDSVPRTPSGEIAIGRDPLSESGDELLMSFAAWNEDGKLLTSYIPFAEGGILSEYRLVVPDGAPAEEVDRLLEKCLADIERAAALGLRITIPITLFPNVLLETNRTSYFGVIQLLPRNGGVRECFIARPGCVYYSCDYGGLELCSWSQICLWMGHGSKLAEAINTGLNVHTYLGAKMAGTTYEELKQRIDSGDKIAKELRGAAKWGNFGFMADMGPVRLVHQLRQQGQDTPHPAGPITKNGIRVYRGQRLCLTIGGADRCGGPGRMVTEWNKRSIAPTCKKCIECAAWIKEEWRKAWPEHEPYFKTIQKISDLGWQRHPISKRIRGGVDYSAAANGFFQELAAQGAKAALRAVTREQYDSAYRPKDLGGERSILFNRSRSIAFLHDELFGEIQRDILHDGIMRIDTVMEDEMKQYIPDVRCKVEPTAMEHWFKQAQPVWDAGGRLQVWQPKKAA
jgi:DNA polymerase-1